jgi:rare lipoprotein A
MRRFRNTRGRIAARLGLFAVALVPSVAITLTIAAPPATGQAKRVLLAAEARKVRFGRSFRLHGEVPGAAHRRLVVAYHPIGGGHWVDRHHLTTGPNGGFETRLQARRSGHYAVRSAHAGVSDPVTVVVRSKVAARVRGSVLAGHRAAVTGKAKPGVRGRQVVVRVGGHAVHTRTKRDGRFRVRVPAGSPGRYKVHASVRGDRFGARAGRRAGRLIVFHHAVASWYGPGLYGGPLACGGTLTPRTLGVANKTLPCGTKVTLRYRGRQVTVPVVDRGPYVAGRDYDLTAATRQRLRFGDVGTLLSSR